MDSESAIHNMPKLDTFWVAQFFSNPIFASAEIHWIKLQRELYFYKFFQILIDNDRTVKINWEWRNLLFYTTEPLILIDLAMIGLKYVLKLENYVSRGVAAFIFQSLMYTLEDIFKLIKEDLKRIEVFANNEILEYLMDNIATYINRFGFAWSEAVETISLMDLILDFICIHSWGPKVIAYDLRMLNKSSFQLLDCEYLQDVRDAYLDKLYDILVDNERTVKSICEWRNMMLQHSEVMALTTLCLKYTSLLKYHISRETAVFLFQSFIYTCEDFLQMAKAKPEKIEILNQGDIFEYLMGIMADYILTFDFTWAETVETISLMDITLDFLSLHKWKPKVYLAHMKILGKIVDPKDDFRDQWYRKLFKSMAETTIKAMYVWRDKFLYSSAPLFDHAVLSLKFVIKSLPGYGQETGVLLFECFFYFLDDLIEAMERTPEVSQLLIRENMYTGLLIECISIVVESFGCRWQETIESFRMMELILKFLALMPWTSKLVVKALKLVDISIKKYMTPNMALLVDRTNDSTLALVGPLLYAKLHDSTWEVRDSALEVICTVAYNAKNRFPSFQKIILDAEIVPLVVEMALNDGESYVRATALKCLQEIIQVPDFWEKLLKVEHLHENLLGILQKEPEGIVRQEGATLISRIYEHQSFTDTLLPKVFDSMSHAATSDLHWEVKLNALNFWEKVISNHLQHQGMIDGTFPNVTFSKEHKKIVTLNEVEVKKRLIKVLHQLSDVGCLAVLVAAVQDDCDVEVSKAATKITKDFVDLLKKYNVDICSCESSQPTTPMTPTEETMAPVIFQNAISECNTPMSIDQTDRIIDEIINAQDAMLLANVCNPSDRPMLADLPEMRGKQIVPASEFVRFSYDNFESYETEKRKWLNNIDDFGSLLDDILKEYHSNDVNSMDCY